jgi:hypothetical protein
MVSAARLTEAGSTRLVGDFAPADDVEVRDDIVGVGAVEYDHQRASVFEG